MRQTTNPKNAWLPYQHFCSQVRVGPGVYSRKNWSSRAASIPRYAERLAHCSPHKGCIFSEQIQFAQMAYDSPSKVPLCMSENAIHKRGHLRCKPPAPVTLSLSIIDSACRFLWLFAHEEHACKDKKHKRNPCDS